MQTRTSFNGGEQSPELAVRCDMDAYMRGCRTLENWEVSQMGGVKRRRGMRYVSAALGSNSRLIPYIYSYADADNVRFLVEISSGHPQDAEGTLRSTSTVRVLNMDGQEVARFTDAEGGLDFYLDPSVVRFRQLNSLLFLTSKDNPPLALKYDGEGGWTLEPWKFKFRPWRYVDEKRDYPVTVSCAITAGGSQYTVEFDEEEEEKEKAVEETDYLRASFWLEQQEATQKGEELRRNVIITDRLIAAKKGDRIAIHGETTNKFWICKQEWVTATYIDGLDDPGSYPDNFIEPENLDGFDDISPVTSVRDVTGSNIGVGTKFAIKSGYWEYFTCIRDFSEDDIQGLVTSFADYPGYFVRGLAISDALTCRGKWEFYCSGLWFGSYEVRKCYDTGDLSGEWEPCGTSFSRVGEASNTQLTGDESDEECYLRLFLTRSKYMNGGLAAGFPPDSCSNRLIVPGYRHDMVLRAVPILSDDGEEVVAVEWNCEDVVQIEWEGRRTVTNWSWTAFSSRYGHPLHVEVYNQRLVFAATQDQPQSLWMSRTDDFNNFATGDSDSSSLVLTMATTSQNPICWLMAQSHRLLVGTSDAEWTISAGSNQGGISPTNAQIEEHGHVGSDNAPCLAAIDKILYIERGGGRCYEYGYSFEIDGYRSKDLTVLAPHVLRDHGGVLHGTMLRKPDNVAVFVLADGQLALCTYNTMHEVNAWHRWVTDGQVLSVCAMPDGTRGDRLFMVVYREQREAGDLVYSSYNIEVVDDDSGYEDVGRDYDSVLVTNALGNPLEAVIDKMPKTRILLYLGSECRTDSLEVSCDGETWTQVPTNEPILSRGWKEVLTINKWSYETFGALRYNGSTGCHFIALQG